MVVHLRNINSGDYLIIRLVYSDFVYLLIRQVMHSPTSLEFWNVYIPAFKDPTKVPIKHPVQKNRCILKKANHSKGWDAKLWAYVSEIRDKVARLPGKSQSGFPRHDNMHEGGLYGTQPRLLSDGLFPT